MHFLYPYKGVLFLFIKKVVFGSLWICHKLTLPTREGARARSHSLWYQNQLLLQKLLSHSTVPETHLEKSRCGQLSNALLTVLTCTQTDTCLPLVDPTLKLLPRPAGPEAKSPSLPEIKPGYFRLGASVTEANPSSWYVQPMPLGATFSQSQHECGPIQN